MNKIRLLVHCPNPKDATSFYRGIGPLSQLHRVMPGLDLHFTSEYNWSTLALCDAVFMQRPYKAEHLQILKMAKANRKRVWVDYDDDLFSVPVSNPAHKIYGEEETKKIIAKCIAHADSVTVSTELLKFKLQDGKQPLNRNITVIPNAFNDYLLQERQILPKERRKLIMWRGSPTHQQDLSDLGEQIVDAVNSNPSWTFQFQGEVPWFLSERLGNNAIMAPSLDPIEYFSMIRTVQPRAMMVPLADHVFNRSKSNIAWLEGVYAGGLAIAPDTEEWRRPGALNYRTPQEFRDLLDLVIKEDISLNEQVQLGWDYIEENLMLSKVNKTRAWVLSAILG